MTVKEITEKAVSQSDPTFNYNGMYTKYLITEEYSPLPEKNVFGCWILVFESVAIQRLWLNIYNVLKAFITEHEEMTAVVKFETIHVLDDLAVAQQRGFNQAYTTDSYLEFLQDGDCKPNEYILKDIYDLHNAVLGLQKFHCTSQKNEKIITKLIHESFIKPNGQLKWTEPWTLYLPSISIADIEQLT